MFIMPALSAATLIARGRCPVTSVGHAGVVGIPRLARSLGRVTMMVMMILHVTGPP
jgi:hypothetical protein